MMYRVPKAVAANVMVGIRDFGTALHPSKLELAQKLISGGPVNSHDLQMVILYQSDYVRGSLKRLVFGGDVGFQWAAGLLNKEAVAREQVLRAKWGLPKSFKPPAGTSVVTVISALDSFRKQNSSLDHPHCALDMCHEVSDDFLDTLDVFGIPSRLVEFDFTQVGAQRAYPYYNGGTEGDHRVVRIGNALFDWTARQFDSQAPVPFIWVSSWTG